MTAEVRTTLGVNIRRIRTLRKMTGQDLIKRLGECGVKLLPSGLSDLEKGRRKLTVEELLALAIVLNTSVIDLLVPEDGESLSVAEGVEPLQPSWLESWLQGETPWPATGDEAVRDEYFKTASEVRKHKERTGLYPEMLEISGLRSSVANAIEGPGPWNEIEEPEIMAEHLRDQAERVRTIVGFLADRLERNGYAAR
ncbi:hypothetical protein BH11ACT7_BH11ACT7_31200 [soil metagenome]